MAWLDADEGGEAFALRGTVTIGSAPDGDAVLAGLAPTHAVVREQRGLFVIEPRGLVWVGGRPILWPTPLVDGDELRLEGHRFRFRLPRILPHGGVPGHLVGSPLGVAIAVLHVEGPSYDAVRALPGLELEHTLPSGHGTELLFERPCQALRAAFRIRAGLAGARLGADFATLAAARAGAEVAARRSSYGLVATRPFASRALLELEGWTRDVVTAVLGTELLDGENVELVQVNSD